MFMLLSAAALASDLLLQGGMVWDGSGAAPFRADVLVHDDRILQIAEAIEAPEGATVLDATGATVLPGLIDSHVHLSMDPGAAWRQDSPQTHDALLAQHLRAYLACGVTTILDPAVMPDELARIRAAIDTGAPGPRYLTLGTPFSPPGGYVAVVIPEFPTVSNAAEVNAQLDLVQSEGVVGIKTTVERGFLRPVWPLYSDEVRVAIRDGATARDLTVYAHAMSAEEQRIAIDELGARVLVHPLEKPDAAMVKKIAASGVYEMTTLSANASFGATWRPERDKDPLIVAVVPQVERATSRDPVAIKGFVRASTSNIMPHLPAKTLFGRSRVARRMVDKKVRETGEAILAMSRAGVPIVMGSDAGNWPMIPYLFHGSSSIEELELLVTAGLSPAEVLRSATVTPAAMLGLDDLGVLRPGARADLVVVAGNPLANIAAMRQVRWTVADGVAATPAQWMTDSP